MSDAGLARGERAAPITSLVTGAGRPEAPLNSQGLALRASLRESLGIKGDFVVGSGHQCGFWHAGIMAKFVAAAHLMGPLGSSTCRIHFLSDQESGDPARIDLPVSQPNGSIHKSSISLIAPSTLLAGDAIAFARASGACRHIERKSVVSSLAQDALDRAIAALNANQGHATLALQVAHAIEECMSRWIPRTSTVVSSGQLIGGVGSRELLERMLQDPQKCAIEFNEALRSDPRSARKLELNGRSSEVPLWGVDNLGRRHRISAAQAKLRLDRGEPLLPRAFLASGLMRICVDTFVHGTGGARYEKVGEQWWASFFGIELPSFVTATATILPTAESLGMGVPVRESAALTFRRAWWSPEELAGTQGDAMLMKRAILLQKVKDAPRRSESRRDAYLALCSHINELRASASAELEELRRDERRRAQARTDELILNDRSWPFLLHGEDAINEMCSQIRTQAQALAAC